MRTTTRIALCFAAIALACATIAMTGGWKNAARSLQDFYFGIVGTFLVLYALTMFAITSTRFAHSYWLIPVAAFVAYPVTTLAYFGYLAAFEHEALLNALRHIEPLGLIA